MIHLAHDVGRTLVVARQVAEQRAGDGHVKRRRHPLPRHVADDEEELITLDDEVVEVAAHLFGWCHRGEKVEVVALGEDGGNHAHLDVVGDDELALEPLLAGRGGSQVLNMLLQRRLHIFEGVAQVQQLVFRLDLRQRCVQIALGDIYRSLSEQLQRLHHLIDGNGAEDEQQRQPHEEHHHAVFHDLVGQRQRHTVACEMKEQDDSHEEDARRNAHDSETEPRGKRVLVCQLVLVLEISTKTLLFKVVFHSSILLSASPVDGHLPAVVAWGL